ncbi:MAG: tryptophan 7-halogenase, partial [Chloroflexota bacterium]
GFISQVQTESHGAIAGDLFIDCTGFRGLLINQALEEPFISFNDVLLCDRAVTINMPSNNEVDGVPPFTTATALSSGWCWQVPLYGRTGNGYVYCSNYISDEAAEAELRQHLGPAAADLPARYLKMRVGRTRHSWVKNCVSIGLSSGFMEPLEATGIFLIEMGLDYLVKNFPDKNFSPAFINNYNQIMQYHYEEVRDFIALHYCLNRRFDTPFWQANQYQNHPALPTTLQARLERARVRLPNDQDFLYRGHLQNVLAYSYTNIFTGMDYLPQGDLPLMDYRSDVEIDQIFTTIEAEIDTLSQRLPDHYEYLSKLHAYEPLWAALRQDLN